ncbi:MAG TPA: MBOAT family O-acyltransferase [Tepidisphaeraceae bacterium]|nr:MBOAT family O-acyltransferase [Tepidisphaeraceae bacterium]
MVFNSWVFFAFFFVVYLLYLPLRKSAGNWLILIASYVFYGYWDVRFLILLGGTTLIDFVVARAIDDSVTQRRKKMLLLISVVSNLSVLGFFKYYSFFAQTAVDVYGHFHRIKHMPTIWHVVLPVGISFYTFQSIAYVVDVYRGQTRAARNLRDFAMFVSFFPQLVAGPIERSNHLLPQMQCERVLTWEKIGTGVWWILQGLFLKVVVADNLAPFADRLFGKPEVTGLGVWVGVLAFTFQIYCDFYGYTQIARGVAKLMGFDLMRNFNAPYLSASPQQFWARWHISLSTWLRDYLYIPLGGNRGGAVFVSRNLMITMLLGGLWHGARWNFVIWGAYHGVLLITYRFLTPGFVRMAATMGRVMNGLLYMAGLGFFFLLTMLGWLFFRCRTFEDIQILMSNAVRTTTDVAWAREVFWVTMMLVTPVIVMDVLTKWTGRDDFVMAWPRVLRWGLYAGMGVVLFLIGNRGGSQFIYFQF